MIRRGTFTDWNFNPNHKNRTATPKQRRRDGISHPYNMNRFGYLLWSLLSIPFRLNQNPKLVWQTLNLILDITPCKQKTNVEEELKCQAIFYLLSVFLFVILCWCPSLEYRSVVVNANEFFCFFYGSNVDFEDHFLLLSDEKVRIEGNYKVKTSNKNKDL